MRKAWQRATQYAAIALLFAGLIFSAACKKTSDDADPSAWGYGIEVFYHAMGGVINQREVRQTYYEEGSYLYEPSGTTGFLVEPRKEGYTLVGWYTDYTEEVNEDGSLVQVFLPEHRWDFQFDRAQEDMTLYAYWIPRVAVEYISVMPDGTQEVFFTKTITAGSGVIELESALESKTGYTVLGYYADSACTQLYDFSSTQVIPSIPDEQDQFDALAAEFPNAFVSISQEEIREAMAELNGESLSGVAVEDADLEADEKRDPYLFIEQYGYRLIDNSSETVAQIVSARKALIGDSLAAYVEVSANTELYLKYIEGKYRRVRTVADITSGGKVSFSGAGYDGYIIARDLDFTGVEITPSDFSGVIYGNGYTIYGLDFTVKSGKAAIDTEFTSLGLWKTLADATIQDLNFKDCVMRISQNSQSSMYAGFLAGTAENVKLSNCNFENILIQTGEEAGTPLSLKGERIAIIGDLFAQETGVNRANCTIVDCRLDISGAVRATAGNVFDGVPAVPDIDDNAVVETEP